MLIFLLLSLATFNVSQGFDGSEWLSKFCIIKILPHRCLICEKINFSKQELEDIRKKEFIISNEQTVIFDEGDIGILDEYFLQKFPTAEEILFKNTRIQLGNSTKSLKHPVKLMNFHSSQISCVYNNPSFFQNLPSIEALSFGLCKFDPSALEKNLFGSDSNLKSLTLHHNNFKRINNDAFEGLHRLEALTFRANLEYLSPSLLLRLVKSKELDFSENQLSTVSCHAIPGIVEELDLSWNRIDKPSFVSCNLLKNLKKLYLRRNNIKSIEESAFETLESLEVLVLDYNNIKTISNTHFKNLVHLKEIYLYGNGIGTTDLRKEVIVNLKI